jgi:hypothetical protein
MNNITQLLVRDIVDGGEVICGQNDLQLTMRHQGCCAHVRSRLSCLAGGQSDIELPVEIRAKGGLTHLVSRGDRRLILSF